MPISQVVVLVARGHLSVVVVLMRLFPWALLPVAVAAVLAFKRVHGWPLHELIPLKVSWLRRRAERRWFRPVPLVAASGESTTNLPPNLRGLQLLDVESSWAASPGRL